MPKNPIHWKRLDDPRDMSFHLILMRLFALLIFLFSSTCFAFEDPTLGKPFLPWLWEDHLKPTIESSMSKSGFFIAGSTATLSIVSHQYDSDVYEHNSTSDNLAMDSETSGLFGTLGGGGIGIGISILQLFVDQENGLKHARALILTSATHVTVAFIASRKRPNGGEDYLPFDSAWPSGHSSSIFASATALAYAYGWIAGVPSFALATAISVARVSENKHWLSDVVAGAGLGIFWGVASYKVEDKSDATISLLPPNLVPGGLVLRGELKF